MISKKKENAVKSLVSLYTVVIGVALSVSVLTLIDAKAGLSAVTGGSVLLFGAFVATLLPFYHGALRHLDDAYLENESSQIKDGALIVDFLLLFFHAMAFVVLALLIHRPVDFAWLLIAVLAIDVIWAIFTHFASSSAAAGGAEGKWGLINLMFVGVAVVYLVIQGIYFGTGSPDDAKVAVPIFVFAVIRTMVDYVWCRRFYFPP
jgi:hypothetical protein